MIYFDNSATTFPKPRAVIESVRSAFVRYGANPGRSGYPMAMETAVKIYEAREKAAAFFGADKPENIIFTPSCTYALNTVINGILDRGDHAVCSDIEHNAVIRPLNAAGENGASVSFAKTCGNSEETVLNFIKCTGRNTKLAVCTHASNVTGEIMPIRAIGRFCRDRGILFAVDAAQSAGVLNIDMKRDCIDFLCVAAHKGLYAPLGTGMLIIGTDRLPEPLVTGGTGSLSADPRQPEILPDRYESGTPNVPGIIGISAGIDFVSGLTLEKIRAHEYSIMRRLYGRLSQTDGVTLHTKRPEEGITVPLIGMNIREMSSEQTASLLADDGVCVRAGLHCAPSAHKKLGTLDSGLVRFSPSVFTSERDIELCTASIRRIAGLKMK